jgi:beta-lactamase superfamily II metal-dependent hydrolase
MADAFAGYPAPYLLQEPDAKSKKIKQLLWGDYVRTGNGRENGFVEIERARGESGWMRDRDLQEDRLLELNFVDVGQGDGCFVVTPDDRRIVIDAGRDDNMFWYLRWRFNLRAHPDWDHIRIDDAIVSHPDEDHYEGFRALLQDGRFHFGNLYHIGLVDHAGQDRLGPSIEHDGHEYYTDIYETGAELGAALPTLNPTGRMQYPSLLKLALEGGRVDNVRSLSAQDQHLPGYDTQPVSISVLGPVLEFPGGKPALRKLGDDGITKNGHSVTAILTCGQLRILVGGDLNAESMALLLETYQADDHTFTADVAKACHHGSSDISPDFLKQVNAIATIVSSGDDEPYAHPRPDALGLIGKVGRGDRPLIFSTELARSSREIVERPQVIRATHARELEEARRALTERSTTESEEENRAAARYQRAVAVYGMICLRTDGQRVVLAQKLERRVGGKSWDVHCLEHGPNGFAYVS